MDCNRKNVASVNMSEVMKNERGEISDFLFEHNFIMTAVNIRFKITLGHGVATGNI